MLAEWEPTPELEDAHGRGWGGMQISVPPPAADGIEDTAGNPCFPFSPPVFPNMGLDAASPPGHSSGFVAEEQSVGSGFSPDYLQLSAVCKAMLQQLCTWPKGRDAPQAPKHCSEHRRGGIKTSLKSHLCN